MRHRKNDRPSWVTLRVWFSLSREQRNQYMNPKHRRRLMNIVAFKRRTEVRSLKPRRSWAETRKLMKRLNREGARLRRILQNKLIERAFHDALFPRFSFQDNREDRVDALTYACANAKNELNGLVFAVRDDGVTVRLPARIEYISFNCTIGEASKSNV